MSQDTYMPLIVRNNEDNRIYKIDELVYKNGNIKYVSIITSHVGGVKTLQVLHDMDFSKFINGTRKYRWQIIANSTR